MGAINVPFEWVADRGLYVSYPCGEVTCVADCVDWLQAHEQLCKRHGGRFDLIVVVDMFVIHRQMFAVFMEHRTIAYDRYIRYSVRVTPPSNPTVAPPTARIHSASDIPSAMDLIDALRAGR